MYDMKRIILSLFALTATMLPWSMLQADVTDWPEVKTENRPGTRWWWLGSAVDKANLTWNMESLSEAGIGSVEITPIYGVKGEEVRDIKYLSPKWMEMLRHVQAEGGRLDMLVDMNGGTGWPFGGPNIDAAHAASKQMIQVYEVKAERAGTQGKAAKTFREQQISLKVNDPKQAGLASLQALLFVKNDGSRQQLPLEAVAEETLSFAPDADGTLYALFVGKTRQMVKRSAPGGEGYVMNHLSKDALMHYLNRFDKAFTESGTAWPHTFFNDSYEVYGADWSEQLVETFKARRGYDICDYLPEWQGIGDEQTIERVVCDYRETIGDMLLYNFTIPWTEWAHGHGVSTRNQAHGSPGNLLDLYAAMDIPECESFGCTQFAMPYLRVDDNMKRNDANPATLRYASSASHVAGKEFTSSESMTWLTEHFRTSLALIKPEMDQLFVSGVNRVFYHGTPYTPKEAPWPGWLFYASIQVNPNNTIFRDMDALNAYITRVQSFMQQGAPDNELLLYFPIYDIWEKYRKTNYVTFDIHRLGEKLPRFDAIVDGILQNGYELDYISDRQLMGTAVENGLLRTENGKGSYKAILVPDCEVMPVETLRQLKKLSDAGAKVLFLNRLPSDVPGLKDADARREELLSLTGEMGAAPYEDLQTLLRDGGLTREEVVGTYGASICRRKLSDGYVYFISMLKDASVDAWVNLGRKGASAMIFNPLTGEKGRAPLRDGSKVYLQLKPGESLIVRTYDSAVADVLPVYPFYRPMDQAAPLTLEGKWQFAFTDGAPAIEGNYVMDGEPTSWTELPAEQAKNYAGSGCYTLTFKMPKVAADDWRLSFTDGLYESARVSINGEEVGKVWSVPYTLNVGPYLRPGKKNTVSLTVTNLPANRIADYDRRGVDWRIFKDINIVSVFYKPITFDVWATVPAGLTHAPQLIPLQMVSEL